jgi:hypothetical protein
VARPDPQLAQNAEPSAFAVPHIGQVIGNSDYRGRISYLRVSGRASYTLEQYGVVTRLTQ